MSESTTDFDVPVEPVWYEASAVEAAEPVEQSPASPDAPSTPLFVPPAAVAPPVEVPPQVEAPTPPSDDILPLVEPAAAVEARVEEAPPAVPREPRPPRQWGTLPVVAALIVAALIGFVIGRVTDSSSNGSSSNSSARGSSAKGGAAQGQPAAGTPQAQTPAPGAGSTATSVAPGDINGHTVLLNIPRHTGPLITDHFTVTANRWVLGWAYDCTAQGGAGAFNITVFDGSGGPSKDGGIDQQGGKGSSVVAYTSTGERYLSVTTNCVWAIRVTT